MSSPASPHFPEEDPPRAEAPGEAIDDGRGRVYPCSQCGADLQFSIGQQSLACPYCGHVQEIALPETEIEEHDYDAMIAHLEDLHLEGFNEAAEVEGVHEVRCGGCGANVVFEGTLTSSSCPYCATPLQREQVHNAQIRVKVDAVLPFLVTHERAATNLRNWVKSLWFAPNDFKKQSIEGKFHGCYYPYYTFDADTFTIWSGSRGDHYYVTVQHGKTTTQERRTRWTSVDGRFDKPFDDVLVLALQDERSALLEQLEPWPLEKVQPFTPQLLAGMFARSYDIPLKEGFQRGRQRMDAAIRAEVIRRIGGDEQRISSQKSRYSAVTFKHLLLPVWLLAYQYRNKTFRLTVNAATGEVQGERPYSWIKITLFVLMIASLIVGGFLLFRG